MHARHAVGIQRSREARGIRRAHRDFGAPPSRHLHHDLGGNHTARLSKVPVVRVAPACSSASTTLASHAFMLVLRAVRRSATCGYQAVEQGERMWRAYARCRAARAKLSAPCTRVARATCCGCCRVRTPQRSRGHSASAPRHPASAGRARGEDGGAPRTSTRRGRRPAWRGRRHDFPISCSHAEPFIHTFSADPCATVRSAQRQRKTMSPPACRTAIACALICQKRLKRDELMRIHQ